MRNPAKDARRALRIAKASGGDAFIPPGDPSREKNLSDWHHGAHPLLKDKKGNPKLIYHGTSYDFSKFKKSPTGEFGPGIYATDLSDEASGYAGTHRGSQKIMPIYMNLRNPFIPKTPGEFWDRFGGEKDEDATHNAMSEGYDGVVFRRPYRIWSDKTKSFIDTGKKHTHFVAFSPNQIKSATGNNGNFDPANPDITKASGGNVALPRAASPSGGNVIQNAVNVAKGIGRAIAPHPQDRVALATGGDPSIEHQPADETGFDAYHGSPHYIGEEGFQDRAIDTGEGTQDYGHKHYFAQKESIAKSYRDALSVPTFEIPHGLSDEAEKNLRNIASDYDKKLSKSELIDVLKDRRRGEEGEDWIDELQDAANSGKIKFNDNPGHMYHVRVHANPDHFLDWDKPLAEQHPVVQKAFAGRLNEIEPLGSVLRRAYNDPVHAGNIVGTDRASPVELSNKLSAAGIPGIKYLDAGSRDPNTGKPTRNFVVFDPKRIQIKRRYARGGDVVDHALRVARASGGRIGYADGGGDPLGQLIEQMQRTAANQRQMYRPVAKPSRDIPLPPSRPPELMTAAPQRQAPPPQIGTAAQQVVDAAKGAEGVYKTGKEDIFGPSNPTPAPAAGSAVQGQTDTQPTTKGSFGSLNDYSTGVASKLAQHLMEKYGLSRDQAVGAVGVMGYESGHFQTMQEVGRSGTGSGWGYAQWTGPRRTNFENYVKSNGLDPSSYEANVGFLDHELEGPYSHAIDNLKKAENVEDSAKSWLHNFEGMSIDGKNVQGVPAVQEHVNSALSYDNVIPKTLGQREFQGPSYEPQNIKTASPQPAPSPAPAVPANPSPAPQSDVNDFPHVIQAQPSPDANVAAAPPPADVSDITGGPENAKRGGYMRSVPPEVARALEVLRKYNTRTGGGSNVANNVVKLARSVGAGR